MNFHKVNSDYYSDANSYTIAEPIHFPFDLAFESRSAAISKPRDLGSGLVPLDYQQESSFLINYRMIAEYDDRTNHIPFRVYRSADLPILPKKTYKLDFHQLSIENIIFAHTRYLLSSLGHFHESLYKELSGRLLNIYYKVSRYFYNSTDHSIEPITPFFSVEFPEFTALVGFYIPCDYYDPDPSAPWCYDSCRSMDAQGQRLCPRHQYTITKELSDKFAAYEKLLLQQDSNTNSTSIEDSLLHEEANLYNNDLNQQTFLKKEWKHYKKLHRRLVKLFYLFISTCKSRDPRVSNFPFFIKHFIHIDLKRRIIFHHQRVPNHHIQITAIEPEIFRFNCSTSFPTVIFFHVGSRPPDRRLKMLLLTFYRGFLAEFMGGFYILVVFVYLFIFTISYELRACLNWPALKDARVP